MPFTQSSIAPALPVDRFVHPPPRRVQDIALEPGQQRNIDVELTAPKAEVPLGSTNVVVRAIIVATEGPTAVPSVAIRGFSDTTVLPTAPQGGATQEVEVRIPAAAILDLNVTDVSIAFSLEAYMSALPLAADVGLPTQADVSFTLFVGGTEVLPTTPGTDNVLTLGDGSAPIVRCVNTDVTSTVPSGEVAATGSRFQIATPVAVPTVTGGGTFAARWPVAAVATRDADLASVDASASSTGVRSISGGDVFEWFGAANGAVLPVQAAVQALRVTPGPVDTLALVPAFVVRTYNDGVGTVDETMTVVTTDAVDQAAAVPGVGARTLASFGFTLANHIYNVALQRDPASEGSHRITLSDTVSRLQRENEVRLLVSTAAFSAATAPPALDVSELPRAAVFEVTFTVDRTLYPEFEWVADPARGAISGVNDEVFTAIGPESANARATTLVAAPFRLTGTTAAPIPVEAELVPGLFTTRDLDGTELQSDFVSSPLALPPVEDIVTVLTARVGERQEAPSVALGAEEVAAEGGLGIQEQADWADRVYRGETTPTGQINVVRTAALVQASLPLSANERRVQALLGAPLF